MHATELVT